jgi:hypothetical protein
MRRPDFIVALLLLCFLPGRLTAQQPYPGLARVVGAVRAAALVASHSSAPHNLQTLDLGFTLPPLTGRSSERRRQVLRFSLGDTMQLRATADWPSVGPVLTLGLGLRF